MLWASIQDTKQREGVVVKVHVMGGPNGLAKGDNQAGLTVNSAAQESYEVQKPNHTQRDRAIARLHAQLEKIAPKREQLKQELEMIMWRQKLLRYAVERAERVDQCGWDQRLIFDEEEFAEFAEGVFESYEESHAQPNGTADDAMQVDSAEGHGEWWCRGKKKCQRHAGYVSLHSDLYQHAHNILLFAQVAKAAGHRN